MHKWITVRLDTNTRERLKQFRLTDDESIDTTLSRILNAVNRPALIKQVADEVEERLKKNSVGLI